MIDNYLSHSNIFLNGICHRRRGIVGVDLTQYSLLKIHYYDDVIE